MVSNPESHRQIISRQEAADAMLRSGYLLESRVQTTLRGRHYFAQANAVYKDPDTGKSRELDIHALDAKEAGPNEHDFLFNALLIECVNNPQPMVFIMREASPADFLQRGDIRLSGLPAKLRDKPSGTRWVDLAEAFQLDKYHHYCKGRTSTQFCSFHRKQEKGQWMAMHEGAHFDAFKKLCDAVDFYQNQHFQQYSPEGPEWVNVQVYYPILVVQGELLEANPTRRSVRLKKSRHVQFRRFVAGVPDETSYQIDVVQERHFAGYLDMIERELARLSNQLRKNHVRVRDAIDAITAKAKALPPERRAEAIANFTQE